MRDEMALRAEQKGDVTVVTIDDRYMDGSSRAQLTDLVQSAIESERNRIILDLGGVTSINSTGMGIIVASYVKLRNHAGDLRLACLSSRVLECFRISMLDTVFQIYPTTEKAILSFEQSGEDT